MRVRIRTRILWPVQGAFNNRRLPVKEKGPEELFRGILEPFSWQTLQFGVETPNHHDQGKTGLLETRLITKSRQIQIKPTGLKLSTLCPKRNFQSAPPPQWTAINRLGEAWWQGRTYIHEKHGRQGSPHPGKFPMGPLLFLSIWTCWKSLL